MSTSTFSITNVIKRITGDTLIYGVGIILSRAIGFLLLPIYTRAISPAEYASVDVLMIFSSILLLVTILGLDSGLAAIFQTEDIQHQRRMTTSNLIFQIFWMSLLTGGLLLISRPLTVFLLNNDLLTNLTILALLIVPAQAIVGFAQNLHKWRQEPIRFAVLTIGITVTLAGLNIWFVVYQELGARGILLGMLIANTIFGLIGLISISRHLAWGFSFIDIRLCLALGLPFALGGVFQMLLPNINRTLLVDLIGLEATGNYAAGFKLSSIILFAHRAVDLAYFPYAISIQNKPEAKSIYAWMMRIYAFISILLAAALFLSAEPLIPLILGNDSYKNAYQVVGPLLLAFWLDGLRITFTMGFIIAGKTHHFAWIYALVALISWPLNWLLISIWGLPGGAWATVGIELFLTGILFIFCQRVYYIAYKIRPLIVLFITYVGLIFVTSWIPPLPFIPDISLRAICSVVFLAIILKWSGAIKPDEVRGLLTRANRLFQIN